MDDENWLPIETAPKDGTRVILAREFWADTMCIGFWDVKKEEWMPVLGRTTFPQAKYWKPAPKLSGYSV